MKTKLESGTTKKISNKEWVLDFEKKEQTKKTKYVLFKLNSKIRKKWKIWKYNSK